jgi:hypothetical protein
VSRIFRRREACNDTILSLLTQFPFLERQYQIRGWSMRNFILHNIVLRTVISLFDLNHLKYSVWILMLLGYYNNGRKIINSRRSELSPFSIQKIKRYWDESKVISRSPVKWTLLIWHVSIIDMGRFEKEISFLSLIWGNCPVNSIPPW